MIFSLLRNMKMDVWANWRCRKSHLQ